MNDVVVLEIFHSFDDVHTHLRELSCSHIVLSQIVVQTALCKCHRNETKRVFDNAPSLTLDQFHHDHHRISNRCDAKKFDDVFVFVFLEKHRLVDEVLSIASAAIAGRRVENFHCHSFTFVFAFGHLTEMPLRRTSKTSRCRSSFFD